jgi:hypothetical protein
MLKLRTIGIRDYRVLEGRQRIGRIRFAEERMPGHLDLEHHRPHPRASDRNRPDLEEAKVRFKRSWLTFKDRTAPSGWPKRTAT